MTRSRGAPKPAAERDGPGARTGSDHPDPLRAQRESPHPPPSFPASEAPDPAEPPNPQRSGIGLEHALEAIIPSPRAKRESLILVQASLRAKRLIPRSPQTRSGAGRAWSTLWKRSSHPPAQSAKASSSFELPCGRRPVPRSPPTRSGAGSAWSTLWKRSPHPPRLWRESVIFPELPCERRPVPRSPLTPRPTAGGRHRRCPGAHPSCPSSTGTGGTSGGRACPCSRARAHPGCDHRPHRP
ncbi:MAG: hypothetical protein RIT19_29 [Verrucomicrobiota bacterium]